MAKINFLLPKERYERKQLKIRLKRLKFTMENIKSCSSVSCIWACSRFISVSTGLESPNSPVLLPEVHIDCFLIQPPL